MALPSEVSSLAAERRLATQSTAARVWVLLRRLWAGVDPGSVLGSWDAAAATSALRLVTAGQLAAASGAQAYVTAAMSAQGVDPDPVGVVAESAFAGVASDGRDLGSLLRVPAQDTVGRMAGGMLREQAMASGLAQLERIVVTQVADAGRVAAGVAMVNDRRTRGYVRQLTPPSCSRCVLLAGKFYAVNKGFQRHPHCDCVNMPAGEVIEPQSPKAIFASMSHAELRKAGWAEADIKAIGDGVDLAQVTNARRGLRSVTIAGRQVQTTTVGTTKRGLAGQRARAAGTRRTVRLTPEQIYLEAGEDRELAIKMLRENGFIL